jgi:hypothetical protein
MSDTAAIADPPPQPAAEDRPSRFAPLLSIVRKLIDYGRQLATAVQQSNPNTDIHQVAIGFGTYDVKYILARIIRGLLRADELATRLQRLDSRPEPPQPPPAVASLTRKPHAPATPATRAQKTAPIAAVLPTPEQIAEQVRRRPIGEVLADICRDLGILPSHPLWRELRLEIIRHGGNLARLMIHILSQPLLDRITRQPFAVLNARKTAFVPVTAPGGTGPP